MKNLDDLMGFTTNVVYHFVSPRFSANLQSIVYCNAKSVTIERCSTITIPTTVINVLIETLNHFIQYYIRKDKKSEFGSPRRTRP